MDRCRCPSAFDLRRRHGAHQEEIVAKGRRHVGDLGGDRVEHAVPDEIEAERLDQRHIERRHNHQHRGVVEKGAHEQEAELHQDQDHPGIEAQLLGEEVLDRLDRSEAVEHRTEAQRRQDDPHEHAGDRQGLTHVLFSNTSRVMRPLQTAAAKAVMAPMAELSTSEVQPLTKGTIMAAKIASGRHAGLQQLQFFGPSACVRASSFGSAGPSCGWKPQRTAM